MAQPQPVYAVDIPTVHASHPVLPEVLGNMDLNRPIHAGTPINPEDRTHAKSVAAALRAILGLGVHEGITAAVVEFAELRAFAVESAHTMATFTPVDMAQTLQGIHNQLVGLNQGLDQRFGELQQGLEELNQGFEELNQGFEELNQGFQGLNARTENIRISARNYLNGIPGDHEPLFKTRAGDGVQLAINIFGNIMGLQHLLVPPVHQPLIGSLPPFFHRNFSNYQRADIINLIIFYNEAFGINGGDSLQVCVNKFQRFLITL